ncbi:hypothetical protein Prum_010910 [Phytohabitans rumicis]|uniref:Inositol polyphosphate-related phosphatase domain-containing protein n=1 Tax=Phytohabitans rumicis TaxID=1076125 RepID=A0A6V8KYQ4_9ACTN|nr:hypothetical protein [Phytohabitans rumicis]GFJ87449.1 hypothetical protein Prum_010910 [Phytohabitans rumicis]
MRVRLAEGVYVDFYNLHADAGSDSGDLSARAANFAQLSSFISSHSAGNAVVVMGDTNTRYTRATDGTTIRDFASANGLTDVWVELTRGGNAPAEGSDAWGVPSPAAPPPRTAPPVPRPPAGRSPASTAAPAPRSTRSASSTHRTTSCSSTGQAANAWT